MNRSYSIIVSRLLVASFLIATMFLTTKAYAQEDFWVQTNGPYGDDILSLAINSSGHIFAGTSIRIIEGREFSSMGVYRSTDNGNSWTQVNTGLTNTQVNALAINSSGHIFAGTKAGVYRSEDNGDSWTQVKSGLTVTNVLSLSINPSGHIFAGTNGGAVFRSTDNGNSWTQVKSGFTDSIVIVYALVINTSGHIFAGTKGGVYRSTDNGNSWTQVNTDLTNTKVNALAINLSGHIFAGTNGRVFRSVQPTVKPTAVEEECVSRTPPTAYALSQNYPNPFNPSTTITYNLPKASNVTLSIYSVTGQKVTTLVSGHQEPGHYQVSWDGRDASGREVASGVYLYRLKALDRGFEETRRMVLLR